MLNDAELTFDALLGRAIADWPDRIDLKELIPTAREDAYRVPGLAWIEVDIEEKYLEAPDEILMRNMHHAILVTIHKIAKECVVISPSDLRRSAVRQRFEDALKRSMQDTSWQEHLTIARRYFLLNRSI